MLNLQSTTIERASLQKLDCSGCSEKVTLDFDFTMAFQPIIDVEKKEIFAQEALVRGLNRESAGEILSRLTQQTLYKFDQMCRVKAVGLAARLGIESFLSINFMPNAVYRPENCLRTTLKAAAENDFPIERIIFEITEAEKVADNGHLKNIVTEYQRQGFKTALDDFGAGYAGLNLLSAFQPNIIKLDMELTRSIDTNRVKQTIVKSLVHICADLGITLIAEGIETKEELTALRDFGITLFQGYHFAKPSFESLAPISTEFVAA
jgi:EAL domain-containing protein (putative c-di-GMP-specific phosphodiesterase class I)